MNIAFLHRNAQIGGANTYLLAVIPELIERGHNVDLMVGGGPLLGKLKDVTRGRVVPASLFEPLNKSRLDRLLRARNVDVVDAHTVTTAQRAQQVCGNRAVPFVQHAHSLIPLDKAQDPLKAAAKVMSMNRTVARWVRQIPGVAEKSLLTRLPVDQKRFKPSKPDQHQGFRILYCGRLSRRKAAYALDIMDKLPELEADIPGLRFTVVGGRSRQLAVWLKAMYANRRLGSDRVRIVGSVLDTAPYMHWADLVIGTGYVVLEALATATYAIGVGIQGLTNLITADNVDQAIEMNFGDHDAVVTDVTAEDLAEQIRRAHVAWQQAPQLQWGPQLISQRFSVQRAADDLERAFTEAMAK